MKQKIIDGLLWVSMLFRVPYYVMLNPYSKGWDNHLNYLMQTYDFTFISEHTAKLGTETIWIANHPYKSFTPYEPIFKVRPSRVTIFKAHKKLIKNLREQYLAEENL